MRFFILALALAATSCATHRQLQPAPRPPIEATSGGADEMPGTITPPSSQLTPAVLHAPLSLMQRIGEVFRPTSASAAVPRSSKTKCWGCITNNNYGSGTQTNVSSNTEKKANSQTAGGDAKQEAMSKVKGTVAQGGSTAKDQSDAGIASDLTGDNNKQDFKNSEAEKRSIPERIIDNITSPIGAAIGFLLIALAIVLGIRHYVKKKAPLV